MTKNFDRLGAALVAAASLALGTSGASDDVAVAALLPTPGPVTSAQTPPPLSATATPAPTGQLVRFAGQILDDRSGFVFFTTGDGFRVDPNVKIDDAATGGPTALAPTTRTYARATFDASGTVVELALSSRKLPDEANYADVKRFAVALSTPYANPDLGRGEGLNGRPVLVTFTVEVPSKTPFTDAVYVATDTSGWSATAIRMNRIDALHYRVTRPFASGTKFLYRYTRGSWRSAERGQNGLEVSPRPFTVVNADVKSKNDVVYSWGDADQFAPDLGAPIPTPFNPVPFVLPPRRP
ncbi:MAG: hypothetical protein NVSMB59_03000 [Vulcanimicrobiaceae bacterium]